MAEEKTVPVRRQTIVMPLPVHRELRVLAAKRDRSQQDLLEEALDDLFCKYDLPSWEHIIADYEGPENAKRG